MAGQGRTGRNPADPPRRPQGLSGRARNGSRDRLMPEVAAGPWRLQAKVPDGIFTLAIEASDDRAPAEDAAFADRCLPLLAHGGDDPQQLKADIIRQLAGLRQAVAGTGLGYLGALSDVRDGRPALLLLRLGTAPPSLSLPDRVEPASLLAAMLRHEYPDAHIEDFPTSTGVGVGLQYVRDQTFDGLLPGGASAPPTGNESLTLRTGIAQALVPFPEAGLLGMAVGFSLTAADLDLAAVFAATIAFHMTLSPQQLSPVLS